MSRAGAPVQDRVAEFLSQVARAERLKAKR